MTELAELDSIASELLAVPIDEFTASRNSRAAELKAAGNRDLANAVTALRRPSPPLWGANQLARDARVLERVRTAAQAATEAQSGTSAATLRTAAADLQRALDEASNAVREALSGSGSAPAEATIIRARELIRVAALDGGNAWDLLVAGALIREPEALPNTTAFAGPPATSTAAATPRAERAPRHADELREARRTARADAQAAEQAVKMATQLRTEADRLTEQAQQATTHAAEAEDAAARAQERASVSARAADALDKEKE